jgi:hypothetical protein
VTEARRWAFRAAAAIPCLALLAFCGFAIHEWWLIHSHQIVITPIPRPGESSVPEMPAARLLPFIAGSALLAATFAYALARSSRAALIGGYAIIGLLIVVPYVWRML